MRLAGDIQLDQWIFVTVFPFHRLFAVNGRACQEGKAAGNVLKDDFSVIWVYTGLHREDPQYDA